MEVTGGFLLLLAWLNYVDTQRLLPMALLAAAMHEAGHLIAVYALGGRVSRLRLSAVGAELRLEGLASYRGEILCALAGPAVNLLSAVIAARAGRAEFAGIHLALGVFNLLPVSALDGGRCVLAVAGLLTDADRVAALRQRMDGAVTLLLAAGGGAVFWRTGNLTALIVTGWLALAAARERWKRVLPRGGETAKMFLSEAR